MYGGGREDWAPEAETMQQAGFASLALDLRGQGDTGGEENWGLAVEDVAAAQAWIASQPDVDSLRRGTVGASIGANLALTHAAVDPEIRAVALLSPGLNYFGVSLEGLMSSYGARPILLAASDKDAYSADTAQVLAGEASGQVDLLLYPGSAHGTELLYRTHGDFFPELMRFLQESLAP
jgi:dienelactone hydrolase